MGGGNKKVSINSCLQMAGYHKYEENNQCEANTLENCGAHGAVCTKVNGTSTCTADGQCKVKSCDQGYHEDQGVCVDDDVNNCGGINCEGIYGWEYGKCDKGTCKVDKCTKHYHKYGDKCEVNDIDNCLAHNESCSVSHAQNVGCSDTIGCFVSECDSGYHIISDRKGCSPNTDTSCGTSTSYEPINCRW